MVRSTLKEAIERDDVFFESPSHSVFLFQHDLLGKPATTFPDHALSDGFRDQANPEYRIPGFVEQLHLPFGVLLQAARNAAEQIAGDLGHFSPGSLATFEFRPLIGRAGVVAVADPEKIQRHD
jgi:hypothetical protein